MVHDRIHNVYQNLAENLSCIFEQSSLYTNSHNS